ncbi:YjcG family protein [Mesobacillus maritimus]|uniref:YjcG family protein n=1 Tax=Mesobacillus maritimus TaxID=1643336 RepID=UPI00203A6771|nr:YjcG family protein [Mesobacillus maritimus]MCM3586185.1 YjcG family protein [Mesobacillus maritimus]
MKYGVVIFPSKKVQDFANSYRKRYDSNYALIPPHLTIKSAFEATNLEIQEIAQQIHDIAEKHEPLTLRVTKFSSFAPVNNVIYLKVEASQELEKLHNDLNMNFNTEPEYSFVPHITIGQNLSDDEHSDVYQSLRMNKVLFEEPADRMHLLYQLENGSWTVYETFRLGKEK